MWNRLNIENNIMKYSDIINDYKLWMEYVDTTGIDSEEDFNRMTFAEKLEMIKACFGLEANA